MSPRQIESLGGRFCIGGALCLTFTSRARQRLARLASEVTVYPQLPAARFRAAGPEQFTAAP
jgi:hypothetical protein